ncbi:hypothetical protein [Corynebacterium riegelii]|uniref:hypothetical protein n=1 Tax=Corynebacterium riegelii TaxID=156976 RepID=UPI00288A2FDB|nr:hypothetical protein [Corynebacterium riegelii]
MPIDHLPERMKPAAYRTRSWCLTDSPALVILGLGIILRGVSYTPWLMSPSAQTSHPAEGMLSMTTWAIIWIAAGIGCVVAAFAPRAAPVFVGAGVGLSLMWGLSFIADSIIDRSPRGWLPSVSYLQVAALVVWAVWKGRREEITKQEVRDELHRA